MTAYYPSTVKSDFTTKVDYVDPVYAEHVNTLQDEVSAIESNLGTAIRVGSGWVGSFDQVTTTWDSLKDRLANIEYGLGTAYNNSVSILGGSTIQSSTNSTISLILKSKSGQTADLVQLQLSDGTVVSKVDSSGNIYTSGKQVVPVVYSASQPASVPTGTIWIDSTSNVAPLTTQSGIPSGGTSGQSLIKSSNSNYETTWSTISGIPAGGTTGQTLIKSNNSDYETTWANVNPLSTDDGILLLMGAVI